MEQAKNFANKTNLLRSFMKSNDSQTEAKIFFFVMAAYLCQNTRKYSERIDLCNGRKKVT